MTASEMRAAIKAAYRAKKLTALHRDVLYAINTLIAENPSERRLAGVAGCSISTVKRAKARAKSLNLFHWTRRVVAGIGWRAQISNAYHRGPGQIQYSSMFSRSLSLNLSERTIGLTDDVLAARDALADVARRMEGRLRRLRPG